MSQELVVYVGPYAAWDSSTRKKIPVIDPETNDILHLDILHDIWDQDQRRAKSDDGRTYRICYAPNEKRPGGPRWQFYSVADPPSGLLVNDLRGVDAEGEVKAFATAFAVELKVLEEKLGKPPVLGWGIIRCMG